eukprot:6177180-Pleurochrysis_carterae.AAC.4
MLSLHCCIAAPRRAGAGATQPHRQRNARCQPRGQAVQAIAARSGHRTVTAGNMRVRPWHAIVALIVTAGLLSMESMGGLRAGQQPLQQQELALTHTRGRRVVRDEADAAGEDLLLASGGPLLGTLQAGGATSLAAGASASDSLLAGSAAQENPFIILGIATAPKNTGHRR